jgi:hypothetical protein
LPDWQIVRARLARSDCRSRALEHRRVDLGDEAGGRAVRGGKIVAIDVLADPARLDELDLAAWAG